MELKKIRIGKNNVEFINESRDTRSGFAHDTNVFINGCMVNTATCHYLNRTWECYRYQTVMKKAVYDLIDDRKLELKHEFLTVNNYKRLTDDRKLELEKIVKKDRDIKLYKAIIEKLEYRY